MKRVTRDDIDRLSIDNPTIQACLDAQRCHGVKWEEALMAMVWHLHEDLRAQRAMNVRLMERMPAEGVTLQGGAHDGYVISRGLYDFSGCCDVCRQPNNLLYSTNKGRKVCAQCSAGWSVDVSRNELIEPQDVLYG